jgi:pimeloyl-ACP methyl ester carboxylesterase
MTNNIRHSEFKIKLEKIGLTLSGIKYGDQGKTPILALHGWLDNAASFKFLSQHLQDYTIYAVDFAGHGNSDHLPFAASYTITEYVNHVFEIAEEMGWEKFHLLGHSLGACVASIFAGTFPERISSLLLIEGIGPLSRIEMETPEAFAFYIKKRNASKSRMPSYQSFDDALAARVKGSEITTSGATPIVERGIKEKNQRFYWKTDPRLTHPSAHRLTEAQVLAFLERIACPTTLISAKNGYPYHRGSYDSRINAVSQIDSKLLSGQHHLHLDDPLPTAKLVSEFAKTHWNK